MSKKYRRGSENGLKSTTSLKAVMHWSVMFHLQPFGIQLGMNIGGGIVASSPVRRAIRWMVTTPLEGKRGNHFISVFRAEYSPRAASFIGKHTRTCSSEAAKPLLICLPFFSTLQPKPLQLRRELRVQQRGPPTPGGPPPPRHSLAPLPGRGGHCDRPCQPGVPQLPAVGRGAGIQRAGTPTFQS